jgi:hypothetical protein
MKRDIQLIRHLLLLIEESQIFDGIRLTQPSVGLIGITQWNVDAAAYNLTHMLEAGFLAGRITDARMPLISKLTWKGHDLLDDIRDPYVWSKALARLTIISSANIDLVVTLARAEARSRLGLLAES